MQIKTTKEKKGRTFHTLAKDVNAKRKFEIIVKKIGLERLFLAHLNLGRQNSSTKYVFAEKISLSLHYKPR